MAEPKGYELIQQKLKKTAAAVRLSQGQPRESYQEQPKGQPREPYQEQPKEQPREPYQEQPKEQPREPYQEQPKEQPREQLREHSEDIQDLIRACEHFLRDETLSPMEALRKPLIANLVELIKPALEDKPVSMLSANDTNVEQPESDTPPTTDGTGSDTSQSGSPTTIIPDTLATPRTLNPFADLHICLEDATKEFTSNGEEQYCINIEGTDFRIVEPERNDYNGIINKYLKLLPAELHADLEKLRNYARFTAGEVDRLDRETMIGIADFEKGHAALRSGLPAMGDFAAEYRHALHIIKNPAALRHDRPAKHELNQCAHRTLALLLGLDKLAPICLPATTHTMEKTLTSTLIATPDGVALTDLSYERRGTFAMENETNVCFLRQISELQVLDYISGIVGRSDENIMIVAGNGDGRSPNSTGCVGNDVGGPKCVGEDELERASDDELIVVASKVRILALPTERMFGKLGDWNKGENSLGVVGERAFVPANMRVIPRSLKRSLDGLEKNMLELVLSPFGITEAELAAIRTRINNILDAIEHHQVMVLDEKDWERVSLTELAEFTEDETGAKQCANVYAIFA